MSCEVHGLRGPYRVGLVIPLQGPGGLFAPSCEAVAELTVHQLNLNGGICGRRVEFEIVDAGRPPGQVAADVCTLLDRGRIHAVTGWHISAVRERVARSGAQATENLFAAAAYFGSLATAGAMDLLSAYLTHHGPEAPVLNNMAESCHEGLLTLQALYARSRSCRMADLVSARDRLGYDGPRGPMQVADGFSSQDVYLARADAFDFDVLARLPATLG